MLQGLTPIATRVVHASSLPARMASTIAVTPAFGFKCTTLIRRSFCEPDYAPRGRSSQSGIEPVALDVKPALAGDHAAHIGDLAGVLEAVAEHRVPDVVPRPH